MLTKSEWKALAWLFVVMVALLSAASLLTGCTSPHTRVENWPTLKVTVHEEPNYDRIYSMCYDGMPTWQRVMIPAIFACAWIDLGAGTCDVYVVNGEHLEHELQHCAGWDHDGILQGLYNSHVAR
jgi:hypothetical protein